MLELGISFDLAQFVMDNEMIKMIRKVVGGISINDEDMAIDIIKSIGPGGEFISHKHTVGNFKKLQSNSKLIDRTMRGTWLEAGAKDFTERAYEEVDYILQNHKPEPLPKGVPEILKEIIADAEKEYKQR